MNCSKGTLRSFAIIACQRSGTHLLREILNSNPNLAIVTEALSPGNYPGTWYNFLARNPAERVPPATAVEATTLLDEYLSSVRSMFETPVMLTAAEKNLSSRSVST